ncbi:hypothetical protein [Marinobacter sp.]|uniref:hypothetical protein n=1 Tax=Marinobacter sp. TaxID=50741 RepID=UPI00262473D5|nr:hypothetical protein [Marinobacter sp.]
MNAEETLFIALLFSITGVAAHYLGFDIPEPLFLISSLVLVIVVSLGIFHLCLSAGLHSNSKSGGADTVKTKGRVQHQSPTQDSKELDQKALDRKAMEAVRKDSL